MNEEEKPKRDATSEDVPNGGLLHSGANSEGFENDDKLALELLTEFCEDARYSDLLDIWTY